MFAFASGYPMAGQGTGFPRFIKLPTWLHLSIQGTMFSQPTLYSERRNPDQLGNQFIL